jgi:UDP-glucose 4-epimerase
MSKSLVTGCAGFIGSHLCEALLARGERVVGVDCLTDFYPLERKLANLAVLESHNQFEFAKIDLNDPGAIAPRLNGVERVYHLAARAGVRSSWGESFDHYVHENLSATQRLLEACVPLPIHRIVNASSSSVYGNTPDLPAREDSRLQPASPYGVTKLAAEKLCDSYREERGAPTVSLRLFTVFGPRQRPDMAFDRFIRAGLRGEPIHVFGDGSQVRNFTYVADVVEGFILAGVTEHVSPVYNIGGGSTARLREVLEHIEKVIGKPLHLQFEGKVPGDVAATDADTTLAQKELGFAPKVDWREGIVRQAEWVSRNL